MLKYQIVIDDLRQAIKNGTYPAYSQLPSVSKLCEQYDVSKITINKALGELEAQGLISRRRGSGSFVKKVETSSAAPDTNDISGQMTGFLAEHVGLTTTFVIAGTVICGIGLVAFCIPSVMRLDRQSS